MDLKGKEYATVPARIKEFRQANPNGLIETKPQILEGEVMFSARILKDKSKPESGEATGHAIGKRTGEKAFEKLETIAVGRALALLGYMASGEIASSEEMEEFNAYQENKKVEAKLSAIEKLQGARTLAELGSAWSSLSVEQKNDSDVYKEKEALKANLK